MSPQNPDLDSEALLALTLPQLVQKLHNGELSPQAVLFTYLGKVRPTTASSDLLAIAFLHRLWGKPGLEFILPRALVVTQCQGLLGWEGAGAAELCVSVCEGEKRENERETERQRKTERLTVYGEEEDTEHVVLARNLAFSLDFSLPPAPSPLVTKSSLFFFYGSL